MDDLNLGSDEPVIRRFKRIIIGGIRHEIVLTDRRLVLLETATGRVRREIGYSQIKLATLGMNALREPEFSLNFTMVEGVAATEVILFAHEPGGHNVEAATRCRDILSGNNVPVRMITPIAEMGAPTRKDALAANEKTSDERPAVPDFSIMGLSFTKQKDQSDESTDTLGSPILVAVIFVAALFVLATLISSVGGPGMVSESSMPAGSGDLQTPAPTSSPITTPPETTAVPTVMVPTPAHLVTLAEAAVPSNGIWVRISSPVSYYGTIKAGGWSTEITSIGIQYYQIPSQNTVVEAMIEKNTGTGDPLDVAIYNGGIWISGGSTQKPYGLVDIQVPVGLAIINEP